MDHYQFEGMVVADWRVNFVECVTANDLGMSFLVALYQDLYNEVIANSIAHDHDPVQSYPRNRIRC